MDKICRFCAAEGNSHKDGCPRLFPDDSPEGEQWAKGFDHGFDHPGLTYPQGDYSRSWLLGWEAGNRAEEVGEVRREFPGA